MSTIVNPLRRKLDKISSSDLGEGSSSKKLKNNFTETTKYCSNYDDEQWKNNEYIEGDSIFSELKDEELNIAIKDDNKQSNEFKCDNSNKINEPFTLENDDIDDYIPKNFDGDDDDDAEDKLQCTQRFIDDICNKISIKQKQNDLNLSMYQNFLCNESQYYYRSGDILQCNNDSKLISNNSIVTKSNENSIQIQDSITNEFSSSFNEKFIEIDINFPTKGTFYDLPNNVEKLIYEYKGISSLYEWQKECLSLPAIKNRKNLVYALPTSGGKTLVAEILMIRELICKEKNVIFILPYVSIVQEKVGSMTPFALNLNFVVEEYAAGKGKCPPTKLRKRRALYIASIEKASVLIDSLIESKRINEIGLIVVDELHLIGEKGRGAVLESLLTKVMHVEAEIQIIGMSATIGNIEELSEFLNADIYTRSFRPVELKEFIKCGKDILEINSNGNSIDDIFIYRRSVDYKYDDRTLKSDPDHLAGLVSEVIPNESCLIFCATRKNCENVAILLSKTLPRKKLLDYKKDEKLQLCDAIEKFCGVINPILNRTIPIGIAYHHSGLTIDERKLLENAYRSGIISVICCTSTLAAGVNLPAKRVIIRAPYIGTQFITLCQYKQMIGRAGRAGVTITNNNNNDESENKNQFINSYGESILICSIKDNINIGKMLLSPMNKILTSMYYDDNTIGLQTLILSVIGLNLANCLNDLIKLISKTLLSVQSNELNISINALVTTIIRNLFKHKILKISNEMQLNTSMTKSIVTNDVTVMETIHNKPQKMNEKSKTLTLNKRTKLELTIIGKAAFKAGIDYKRAKIIYNELKLAQKSLFISNYSHLLYLTVSFNSPPSLPSSPSSSSTSSSSSSSLSTVNSNVTDSIVPDVTVLFNEYNKMDDDTRIFTKLIGINEVHIIKMLKTLTIKGTIEIQLNRLYKVMILNDIINLLTLNDISIKYKIDRGIIQNLLIQSLSSINNMIRLCDEINEFWCFKSLFEKLSYKLDHCCIPELAQLLDLPLVKIYRARQLYNAGFKTIEDIAKATTNNLVQNIEYMSYRVAREIISAAKMMLVKKLEVLQEETDLIMNCLQPCNENTR